MGELIDRADDAIIVCDATGAISRLISQDKQLTNRLLRAAGVPVPAMAEVMNEAAAIAAA